MFGAGYVGAEDRLFFMDVLRHAGRAELSAFAGGANDGDGPQRLGGRAVHRGRPPAAGRRDLTTSTAPRARRSSRTSTRLRRRHQPVHRRGAGRPDQDARRVRRDRQAAGPATGKVDRRDRDRRAGRRDLRQGRRQRAAGSALALERAAEALRRASGGDARLARLPPRRRPRGADHRAQARASPTRYRRATRASGASRCPTRGSLVDVDAGRPRRPRPESAPRPSRAGRPLLAPAEHGASNALLVSARESRRATRSR